MANELSDADADLAYHAIMELEDDSLETEISHRAQNRVKQRWKEYRLDDVEWLDEKHSEEAHPFSYDNIPIKYLTTEHTPHDGGKLEVKDEDIRNSEPVIFDFTMKLISEIRNEMKRIQSDTLFSPKEFTTVLLNNIEDESYVCTEMEISKGNMRGKLGRVKAKISEAQNTLQLVDDFELDGVMDKQYLPDIGLVDEYPLTPIELIANGTFSIDMMAYLWLCVENGKSGFVTGGTSVGKTATLNAICMFIPASSYVVSIEDGQQEIELPHKNHHPHTTQVETDGQQQIDEFDLIDSAVRRRTNHIIHGEIRGEEAIELSQAIQTGHSVYTTLHSGGDFIPRLTGPPVEMSNEELAAFDFVIRQEQVAQDGNKTRKCLSISEFDWEPEEQELHTVDKYTRNADTDEFTTASDDQHQTQSLLNEIRVENGWTVEQLQDEMDRRKDILSHLLENGNTQYPEVAPILSAHTSA